jgi:hypothetical protein
LVDGERDTWLRTARSPNEVVRLVEEEEQRPQALLCDPALTAMLPVVISGVPVHACDSAAASAWAAGEPGLATFLQRARAPKAERKYLSLATLFRGAAALDVALSLVACGTLRAFAARLPGFAWSGAEYLHTNFLDVAAAVLSDDGHWRVRLGRPPLHIVLAMTGAAQDTYRISWLGERRVQLTTGEP